MRDEESSSESFSPLWEESWWDTPEGKEVAEQLSAELEAELSAQDPVLDWMHGVTFESFSTGKKRPRRRRSKIVTLLQFNGDREMGRHRSWTGEDRDDEGRCPWDEWAQEIFTPEQIAHLFSRGNPEDHLRNRVVELLEKEGRF